MGGKAINKEHGTAMGGSNLRSGFGRAVARERGREEDM